MTNINNTNSFELRNLVGKVINSNNINPTTEQLTVIGNSYKYQTIDNKEISKNKKYKIINAIGNVLQIDSI